MMNNYIEQYYELETIVTNNYFKIVNYITEDVRMIKDDDPCIINIHDEINGGTYEVEVIKINKNGTFNAKDINDESNVCDYTFNNIANILDKIIIFNCIENILIKKLQKIIKK